MEKRGKGRPNKSSYDIKSKKISLKLTDEEYQRMQKLKQNEHKNASEMIRDLINKRYEESIEPLEELWYSDNYEFEDDNDD